MTLSSLFSTLLDRRPAPRTAPGARNNGAFFFTLSLPPPAELSPSRRGSCADRCPSSSRPEVEDCTMWCTVTRPRTTAPTFSFLPPPHVRRHAEDRRLAATPSSSDPVSGSVSLSLSLPPSICGLVRLARSLCLSLGSLEHSRCRRRHVVLAAHLEERYAFHSFTPFARWRPCSGFCPTCRKFK